MFLRGHMQNAYVTHDLDKAMEIVGDRFGVEKFDRFDPDMVVNTTSGPQPMVNRSPRSGRAGSISRLSSRSRLYRALCFDAAAGQEDAVPRFHHISLRRDDEAAMREEIAELGLPLAFEGPLSIKEAIPSLVFVYLDGRDAWPLCRVHLEEPGGVEVRRLARRAPGLLSSDTGRPFGQPVISQPSGVAQTYSK